MGGWTRRIATAIPALVLALPAPAASSAGDTRLNSPGPAEAVPACNVQTDVSLASSGDAVVATWWDGGACEATLTTGVTRVPGASAAGYAWSADGGQTWQDAGAVPAPADGTINQAPSVAAGRDGMFVVVAPGYDAGGRRIVTSARSTDGGKTFVAGGEPTTGRPATMSHWNATVAIDRSSGSTAGTVYVAWQEHDSETGAAALRLARSTDGGATFAPSLVLTDDPSLRGYGPQVAVGPEGQVYVVWNGPGGTLYLARSLDRGASFSAPLSIGPIGRTGHLTLCVVGGWQNALNGPVGTWQMPSLAVGPDGSLHVAVASATRPGDEADVVYTRSTDGGSSWSPFAIVNDDGTTSDQYHPAVSAGEDGRVAISWYDRRHPASADRPNWEIDTYATVSTDGGMTFQPSSRLSDVSHVPARAFPVPNSFDMCAAPQRGAVTGGGGGFLVAWADNRNGSHEVPDVDVYLDAIGV